MINDLIVPTYSSMVRRIAPLLAGRFWYINAAIFVAVVTLILAFPSYDQLRTPGQTWEAVLSKAADLRYNVLQDHGETTNAARVNFRLTVPAVAGLFHLGIYGIVAFQFLCGIALLSLSAHLAYTITNDRFASLCIAFTVGATWAGATSFLELRGIFDGVALLLVMCVLSTRRWWAVALFTFLAAWTEERTLIVIPLVVAYHGFMGSKWRWRTMLSSPFVGVCFGTAAYIMSYLLYASTFAIPVTYAGNGLFLLVSQTNIIPMALWTAFEGGWALVVVGLWSLIRDRHRAIAVLVVVGLGAILAASVMVVDVSRTTAFALPALFITLAAVSMRYPAADVRRLAVICAAVSLLWPMYYVGGQRSVWLNYPLPFQLLRWALIARGISMD